MTEREITFTEMFPGSCKKQNPGEWPPGIVHHSYGMPPSGLASRKHGVKTAVIAAASSREGSAQSLLEQSSYAENI